MKLSKIIAATSSLAALLLTTLGTAAHAQTTIVIQPIQTEAVTPAMMIQRTSPEDLAIQQERMDAMMEHQQEQYEKFQKRWNERFNCQVNSWHPENC